MSVVTNVILTFSAGEYEDEMIPQVNEFFNDRGQLGFISCEDDTRVPVGWYGGSKHLEATVCIGAFNHINPDELLEHIRSLPWESPENVRVFMKRQDDDAFLTYSF